MRAVVTSLCLLLLRQIRQFSVTDQPGRNELPRWLCTPRCRSALQWLFHTARLWLRQFYRKGTLTHEAWTAAESFMADIDALESRWSMDPTIVMLVVSQLLVATAIGYATAVEVTIDGFVTFLLCAGFGALVIVYAKRSGWTLSAPPRSSLPTAHLLTARRQILCGGEPCCVAMVHTADATLLSGDAERERAAAGGLPQAGDDDTPARAAPTLPGVRAATLNLFRLSAFFWSPRLSSRCCAV